MPRSRSHSFTIALRVVVLLPDDEIEPSSIVTEQNLAAPDTSIDAAMDYALPPMAIRKSSARRKVAFSRIWVGSWTKCERDIPPGPRMNCSAP